MSNFNLTQYKKQGSATELIQAPKLPWNVAPANTAFAATTQSAVLDDETNLVRIMVDGDAFMDYGANPIALTSEYRLIANIDYWFEVDLESGNRFAFIDA